MPRGVPFLSLVSQLSSVRKDTEAAIQRVIRSGRFILGEEVAGFEKEYASFNDVRYCVGTANGMDALTIALKTLGIGVGDEVIVPANTCVPTWAAVSAVGANIRPVDADDETYNIDPTKIEAAITPRTKAIVPVHLYGQACDMSAIQTIAQRHRLQIVEDNAQAHGATHQGKLTGTFGAINATSFYPTKNLGALGDAGAITTNNATLFKKAMALRNYGSLKRDDFSEIGINSRLDELQAAILRPRLRLLHAWTKERQSLAKSYWSELSGVGDLILPAIGQGSSHVFHLFVVRSRKRDKLKQFLAARQIETLVHYPTPPFRQKAYEHLGFKSNNFPVASAIASTALSLPLWPGMRPSQQAQVIENVVKFFHP